MKKEILIAIICCFGLLNLSARQIDFSDASNYSLITCAPGTEAYSAYGHTALRVVDPVNDTDVVFNYGIFSFQTENFVFKFVKGETDYQLGVYPYKNFIQEYLNENRTVWEQHLNLTQTEKNNLEKRILNDYLPENRVYRYNFFFDNCATRVRDRVLASITDSVIVAEVINEPQTFRQLLDPYIKWHAWMKYGINLAVAKPADRLATFEEEMFLPDYLMWNFELMMIEGEGEPRSLVSERIVLNAGSDEKPAAGVPPALYFAVLLVFIVIVFYFFAENHPWLLMISYALYFIVGLAGLLLAFLAGFSEHPAMAPNYHLLWALPTHVLIFILWLVPGLKQYVSYYWIACIPYYLLVSLILMLTKQYVDSSIFIINGTLFVSAIFIVRRISDKSKKKRSIQQ